MRNVFVVDPCLPVPDIGSPLSWRVYAICPNRSMIDPRLSGKTVATLFPLQSSDCEPFLRAFMLYKRTKGLRVRILRNISAFVRANFYEYVLRCRVEYNSTVF